MSPGTPSKLFADPKQRELLWHKKELLCHKDIKKFLRLDTADIPATNDRELYAGDRHLEYWLIGLGDYLIINSYFNFKLSTRFLGRGGDYLIGEERQAASQGILARTIPP
jgi:hypothetical protein